MNKSQISMLIVLSLCVLPHKAYSVLAGDNTEQRSVLAWQNIINSQLSYELDTDLTRHLAVGDLIELNKEITTLYASIFIRSLEENSNHRLLWLGLASYASELVGQRMRELSQIAQRQPFSSRGYENAIRLLALGNILVAKQASWQFQAYLDKGLPALEHLFHLGYLSEREWLAWSSLNSAHATINEVSSGERAFLEHFSYHEQKHILQPSIFSGKDARLLGLVFANLATSPLPMGSPFSDESTGMQNISSFEQRWLWFKRTVLEEWIDEWSYAPLFVLRDMKLISERGHLGATRLDGYQSFSGCEKKKYLWQHKILRSTYEELPILRGQGGGIYSLLGAAAALCGQALASHRTSYLLLAKR